MAAASGDEVCFAHGACCETLAMTGIGGGMTGLLPLVIDVRAASTVVFRVRPDD